MGNFAFFLVDGVSWGLKGSRPVAKGGRCGPEAKPLSVLGWEWRGASGWNSSRTSVEVEFTRKFSLRKLDRDFNGITRASELKPFAASLSSERTSLCQWPDSHPSYPLRSSSAGDLRCSLTFVQLHE